MAFNIADLFEFTAAAVPDRPCVTIGSETLTFSEVDDRSNRVAHGLAELGIGTGDYVGIHAINSFEWVLSMFALYKLRAVPININYRYLKDELRYLYGNANAKVAIVDREFAPRVQSLASEVPSLTDIVVIDSPSNGSGDERTDEADTSREAIEHAGSEPTDGSIGEGAGSALRSLPEHSFASVGAHANGSNDFGKRSGDDLYVLYTGGTTGMPKGVMWRQEDVIMALGGGIDAVTKARAETDQDLARRAAESPSPLTFCLLPPFMHGAGQFGLMTQLFVGNHVTLVPKFDPGVVWSTIVENGVNSVILTGDAMARPLIEHLEAAEASDPDAYDLSQLISISSTAAVFSQAVKDRYLARFDSMIITDSIGSTESGFNGLTMVGKGQTAISGGGPTVDPGLDVVVLDEELNLIEPGDGRTGTLARGGNIPLGYLGDPEKTAETFKVAADGRRYAVPGDAAKWTDDGRIVLLGRGSVSINSGGEKIYPEEVEQALKAHHSVYDCLVVGLPDERWGQVVTAVVEPRPGTSVELDAICNTARDLIAGYKLPKRLVITEKIKRADSGKPNYPWAAQFAADQLRSSQ